MLGVLSFMYMYICIHTYIMINFVCMYLRISFLGSQLLQKTESIILGQSQLEQALKARELEVVALQQQIEQRRLKG